MDKISAYQFINIKQLIGEHELRLPACSCLNPEILQAQVPPKIQYRKLKKLPASSYGHPIACEF